MPKKQTSVCVNERVSDFCKNTTLLAKVLRTQCAPGNHPLKNLLGLRFPASGHLGIRVERGKIRPMGTTKRYRGVWPTVEAESRFWEQGFVYVAGLDEAGRGPWAGPVTAAAVILPPTPASWAPLEGVRDSKTLSLRQRELQFPLICEVALGVGVGHAAAEEIDNLGIVPATRLAMRRALRSLTLEPEALVLDALTLPAILLPQCAFPFADAHSLSVAAAGIVAKVCRDRWMVNVADEVCPGYGFAQHKGYGTRQHQAALNTLGVCELHRRSFRPVARRLEEQGEARR